MSSSRLRLLVILAGAMFVLGVNARAQVNLPLMGVGGTAAGGGGGSASLVNGTFCANGTTCSMAAVTVGHAMYMGVFRGATGAFSATDNFSDSWSLSKQQDLTVDGDATGVLCAIAGSSGTITVTPKQGGVGGTFEGIALYEVNNSTCTPDGINQANPTAVTACNSGSITTTNNGDFIISTCGTEHNQGAGMTLGSGWANGEGETSGGPFSAETRIGTTAGSFTGQFTYSVNSENAAIVVAFVP